LSGFSKSGVENPLPPPGQFGQVGLYLGQHQTRFKMAFSKSQQEALKSIENRLKKLEVLTQQSGLELDSWLPEVQFPDLSAMEKDQVVRQGIERSDVYKRSLVKKKVRV
jgi:hypothetical protein